MKLKNKKTGEIGYPYFQNWKEITCVIVDENANQIAEYTSLAELNEEWEDYKELKKYWCIDCDGDVYEFSDYNVGTEIQETHRKIGNLFETKKEAEKAVEKLKAWKRLKDSGFKLHAAVDDYIFCLDIYWSIKKEPEQVKKDLKLVFGDE